ncbi:MAG: hypothetical protein V3T84_14440 [Phycisphaerales bacterium]
MGRISEELDQTCRASPKRLLRVVITLKESCQELTPQQLGIDAEPIEGIPGMLAGSLPGESILELCKRDEVQEVTEDFEVST